MRRNEDKPDKNSRSYLLAQLAGGRFSLMLILIFTLINLTMVLLDSDRYFLFSASVPYYLTLFGKAMDNGFSSGTWDVIGAYTTTTLIVSVVILALYLLCWLMSRKRAGWLTGALVLIVLDTSALVLVTYVLYGSPIVNILDLLLHTWVLWELFQAVRANKKLKFLASEPPVDPAQDQKSSPDL